MGSMARSRVNPTRPKVDKTYRSFINGLVTEASGLTFPESSCRDLDNVDIEVNGLVRRRLGLAQEQGGVLIGGGSISDTYFTNDTGGPLSSSPSLAAGTVDLTYDGVTGNGDWTFDTIGGGGAGIVGTEFRIGPVQNNQGGAFYQDLDINQYDRITVSWTSDERTNNGSSYRVLFGSDVSGGGQGIRVAENEINLHSRPSRTSDGTNTEVADGNNYDSVHTHTVTLTKVATNSYTGSWIVRRSNGTIRHTISIPSLGMLGGFIEFAAGPGGQNHASFWYFDNISILLELFEQSSDSEDAELDDNEFAISTHTWSAPNGDGTKNIQVFQVGNKLFFRDLEQEAVSNLIDTTVPPLFAEIQFDGIGTGFIYNTTSSEAAKVKLQSTSGSGRIWFTSKAVVPFYAEMSNDGTEIRLKAVGSESFTAGVESITGRRSMRDTRGVEDFLDTDETPAALSDEHHYNLLNQGWPSERLNEFNADESNWPANSMQWFFGKTDVDSFDSDQLLNQDFGTGRAPRGRIIFDALLGSRDGIPNSTTGETNPLTFNGEQDEKATTGWQTVAFYAGRIWVAGESNSKRPGCIYGSRTIQQPKDASLFMQENDPTSEHFNDLLATDGVVIPIPQADDIKKLVPYGAGLLVMAGNGIWFLYGGEGGFTASNYSVEKIAATGIVGPDTAIATEQAVFFWADNSIHQIAYIPEGGLPKVVDIGQARIFKYYQLITRDARLNATSTFDPISKKVFWFWLDDEEAVLYPSLYNRALILDTRTSAFTKYSISIDKTTLVGIAGAFPRQTPTIPSSIEYVVDNAGVVVTDNDDDPVYVFTEDQLVAADLVNSLKVVIVSGTEDGIRLGEFFSLQFFDYDGFPGIDLADYSSYAVPGEEILEDLARNKTVTYLNSYFIRTENGFNPDMTAKKPSGCLVRARWDFHVTAAGNRWSEPQRAYRYKRAYAPVDSNDTFDTGEEIVYTKLKLRGWGKAVTLSYESESGKDFRLAGYGLSFTADGAG